MPDDYTSLPTLSVGDPLRASYFASLDTDLDVFDIRFQERAVPLQAGVAGTQAASFVDVPYPLDWTPLVSGTVTITYYSKTTNAATTVQMRLYNVTDVGPVADSESTATDDTSDWAKEPIADVAVVAGKVYRLQITGSDDANLVIGYATLL